LDKEEFEKEIALSKRFGDLATAAIAIKPYLEVRLNQVVAHEFGHQLEFELSAATQKKIESFYEAKLVNCEHSHPKPRGYDGLCEVLLPQQVNNRVFISGYCRTSVHEYWAESVAAFSSNQARQELKKIDEPMYELLLQLIQEPEKLIRPVFVDFILSLQASLRVAGELTEQLRYE
jgi:hypothetical protein